MQIERQAVYAMAVLALGSILVAGIIGMAGFAAKAVDVALVDAIVFGLLAIAMAILSGKE